ncbi:MAG: UDP-glucose/GDP-mannose dehydrogenase family protein [Paracoccaceae bacterium]
MRLAVYGCGYVGLVTAAALARLGHRITAVECDAARLARLQNGECPLHEPGLDELLREGMASGLLDFAATPVAAELAILAVGTPALPDGAADLRQLHAAIDDLATLTTLPDAVMVRSTVPVGVTRALAARLRATRPDWRGVAIFNPEFMRQGSAVGDFLAPERVVIGADDATGAALGRAVYAPMTLPADRVQPCTIASAELMKYAANTLLAARLALVNEIAELARHTGADIDEVMQGVGLDSRIGPQFLRAGPGIGGSCFPKDIRALAHQGRAAGQAMGIVDAVIASNDAHVVRMAELVVRLCGGNVQGLRIAALGVTFKAGTDDLRNSPALVILPALQAAGAEVVAYDPMAGAAARIALAGVAWAQGAEAAAKGADALVILTEWPEFAALDLVHLAKHMRHQKLADLRNILNPAAARAAGFDYVSLGRP